MADDIVTRLRASDDCLRYCECAECGDHFGRKCSCPCHGHPWDEAAAEIERLRTAGDALALAYRNMGGLDVAHDGPLRVWEVARRG